MGKHKGKCKMFVIFCCLCIVKHFDVSHCIRQKAATPVVPAFCQQIVSKSSFNLKIDKPLVRILQQGWYFCDQKRPNFSENAKKTDTEVFISYTL